MCKWEIPVIKFKVSIALFHLNVVFAMCNLARGNKSKPIQEQPTNDTKTSLSPPLSQAATSTAAPLLSSTAPITATKTQAPNYNVSTTMQSLTFRII